MVARAAAAVALALIHLTINRLYLRAPVFMASNVVLLTMWEILGTEILT